MSRLSTSLRLASSATRWRCPSCIQASRSISAVRQLTYDHRNRLSAFFTPSGGIAESKEDQEGVHALLLRTGYLRQAHSGIFHYLPLGLRVHEKLERLIDKHMRSIGASKLALSSISSEKLWEQSGRLEKGGAELFRFKDRKQAKYLLSPTHEEEITTLIGSLVKSYKQLPLRVYQVGRKYRDERRPRAGLLRGREFTMKDLYTFDASESAALDTYADVQGAYKALFDELKLPYLVAEADSGTMGGSLSHEYLYPSATGEDTVISCNDCSYTANTEAALPRAATPDPTRVMDRSMISVHHSITADRKTLVNTYYCKNGLVKDQGPNEVNLHYIKSVVPDLDPSVSSPIERWMENFASYTEHSEPGAYSQIINLFDGALPHSVMESSFSNHTDHPAGIDFVADKRIPTTTITTHPSTGSPLSLLKVHDGDSCPRCETGILHSTTAVELGHTFHLGTRYTVPLNANVFDSESKIIPMQQGCHGIGVSRMIPAIAEGFRDETGLGWPRIIAPFEVCVFARPGAQEDAEAVYDVLASRGLEEAEQEEIDVLLDDRDREFVWKMKDADLIGYPVICMLGRGWKQGRKVEVQSRRLGVKAEVELSELRNVIIDLLRKL